MPAKVASRFTTSGHGRAPIELAAGLLVCGQSKRLLLKLCSIHRRYGEADSTATWRLARMTRVVGISQAPTAEAHPPSRTGEPG